MDETCPGSCRTFCTAFRKRVAHNYITVRTYLYIHSMLSPTMIMHVRNSPLNIK